MVKQRQKLTSWEKRALDGEYNLADGHAHQSHNTQQKAIMHKLYQIYQASDSESLSTIQKEFEAAFFALAGQKFYTHLPTPQYQPSCSASIEVVSNYLRLHHKSVSLIHPTFDNLADILKRHKVPLHAIEEETLFDIEQLQRITTDALMIVCPNNPTGREPNQKQFSQIVEVCKSKGILLIIDFSFRFYSNLTTWDQYEVLYKSGIEFIAMEDTGKTFPLLDLKVSTIMANRSIHLQLQDISNDFLLNISPFILKLLTEFVKLEYKNALPSYQNTVNHNRKILSQYLKKSPVKIADVHSRLSVAWLVIPRKWNSMELAKWLKDKNIFVLPGTPFFWNDQRRGENYIRVALAKPVRYFTRVRSSILSPNVFLLDH